VQRLTAETLAEFKRRVGGLEPDVAPRWGRMSARLMIRHLRRALEISMGEVEVPDRSLPVVRTIIWLLFFHLFTIWPPSRARMPAGWLPTPDEEFTVERELLIEGLDRFVRALEEEPRRKAVHTVLGPLTRRSWSRAHAVHFRHHFRQFRL
jgi:hypothetical protein